MSGCCSCWAVVVVVVIVAVVGLDWPTLGLIYWKLGWIVLRSVVVVVVAA